MVRLALAAWMAAAVHAGVGSARATEELDKEMARLARLVQQTLRDRKTGAIQVGEFVARGAAARNATSGGPVIAKALGEQLEKLGVKTSRDADLIVTGEFRDAIDRATRSTASRVLSRIKDRAGETVVELASRGACALVEIRRKAAGPFINSLGMKFALIPAGQFRMGSTDEDKDADDDEKPQHGVRISRPFHLGVCEVTQGEYEAVMGENPSSFSAGGKGKEEVAGISTDRHPVEQVSWKDAARFCNKLGEREGRPLFYKIEGDEITIPDVRGEGYRLPTEAEWEHACRAGTTTRYGFGDDVGSLGEYGWYDGNAGFVTHAVGQKRPNGLGLYDMHGNVWEWCLDGKRSYAAREELDPVGPLKAADRVFRGGSWYIESRYCRSAYRNRYAPEFRSSVMGFRLALVQSGG